MRYNKDKRRLFIGTSGWIYPHWRSVFYPPNLAQNKWLDYYTQHFKTAELNYSFYRLPETEAFKKWRAKTPEDFVFTVKASRYITHIKRLKDIGSYKRFFDRAKYLKEKLGPILFQFPANFKNNEETFGRLQNFLQILDPKLKYAFEFRDQSWEKEEVFDILKKYNCAWVMPDRGVHEEIITADFGYWRMHGPTEKMYFGSYSDAQLKKLAQEISKNLKKIKQAYVYFNNDVGGEAVKNAQTLISFLNG